jgi:hypothetical protein
MSMRRPSRFAVHTVLGLCLPLFAACSTSGSDRGAVAGNESSVVSTPLPHSLEGFEEDVLVASRVGQLAVVHVGRTSVRRDVAAAFTTPPESVQVVGGKFVLLYPDARVVVVDGEARVERTVRLPIEAAIDLSLATDTIGYVTSKVDPRVSKVDLASGAVAASIDLRGLAIDGGSVELRQMRKVGSRLFVQVARRRADGRPEQGALATIDTDSDTLLPGTIELTFPDFDGGARLPGLEPDLPMAVDPQRNLLYVSALGRRPSNTGGILQVDIATTTLRTSERASGGFQGVIVVPPATPSKLFTILHTSTPTFSSHLFHRSVDEAGALGAGQPGAIIDTFDGLDALATNEAGTLLAMANTCLTGFCVNGAGVAFVDTQSHKVLPKLNADAIGFEPVSVHFRGAMGDRTITSRVR